ncbi:Poly [ADP-ribose] polymerase 1 [Orchesella cincta]|uniref:NAD(+) ADP-ribosyltransferase n=1 Tax=Orchesella cincta TaxID=48709 RepID=A0A1D2M6T8_ORCCI|nr:Poly [ADP-ribose] polymerase 1 [Orchesella cincta]
MSQYNNAPIGWQTSALTDSDDEMDNNSAQKPAYHTPDYSDSDSDQQSGTAAGSNQFDPFANLPNPIPVPFGKQSSNSQGNTSAAGRGAQAGHSASSSQWGGHQGSPKTNYNKAPSSSYSGSNVTSHSSSPAKHSHSSNPQQQSQPSLVTKPKDLVIFGKFDKLNSSDQKFKAIVKYVRNSHGLKDSDGKVWVHDVYQIGGNTWKTFFNSIKKDITGSSAGMLLWYKTTPGGIRRLQQKKDGCVAFYDRVCRAFPQNPRNLQAPIRHLIILCAVSLGNVHKDRNGFKDWNLIGRAPDGYNSVKGMGSLCPDWKENFNDDSFEVPCGATKQHQVYKSYDLEFNEYMVFQSKQILVKYAVDLEITPSS